LALVDFAVLGLNYVKYMLKVPRTVKETL